MLCEGSHIVVGAKVCELTDGFLGFVWGLYVGILKSPLRKHYKLKMCICDLCLNWWLGVTFLNIYGICPGTLCLVNNHMRPPNINAFA